MPEPSNENVEFIMLPFTFADPDLYVSEMPCLVVQVCPSFSEALEPVLVQDTLQFESASLSLLAVSTPFAAVMLMDVISVSLTGGTPAGDVKVTDSSSEHAHLPTKGSVVPPPGLESPLQAAQAITPKRKPSIVSLLMTRNL